MSDDSREPEPARAEETLRPEPRPEGEPAGSAAGPVDEVEGLVERAQAGDVGALNELFERYHARMVDMARRRLGAKLRQKEEADDLAQTTFREATRDFQAYQYRGEGSLLRWLVQILQNKIRDRAEYYTAGKRDMGRERSADEPRGQDSELRPLEPPSAELSVTRQVQRDEELAILTDALKDLSEDHRKAITLVFFRGLSLREAGKQMGGRSEDAVRMMLRRAENRLRELTRLRLSN